MRNGRKKKSRGRNDFVSPTACRCDVLLRYLQLRVNVFPKKGHSTTLGDTKRMNACITRAKAPPFGELRCRDSHTNPFPIFCSSVLLRAATTTKIAYVFSRVNQSSMIRVCCCMKPGGAAGSPRRPSLIAEPYKWVVVCSVFTKQYSTFCVRYGLSPQQALNRNKFSK